MRAGALQRGSDGSRAERDGSVPAIFRAAPFADRFRLVEPLDRRARVWRATDASNATVVLKSGPRALIEGEFRTLDRLSHARIVAVHALVVGEDDAAIVLEDLPGGDLVSLAGSPATYWLPAIAGVIDALRYLHDRRLVHRDLKARNVRFDATGDSRLIDFGSAGEIGSPFTRGGTTAGAVRPDRGDAPVDVTDDVYALAALVYEMLQGFPPAAGTSAVTPASAPLTGLVNRTLEAPMLGSMPSLDDFAAGVKSTLEMARNRT